MNEEERGWKWIGDTYRQLTKKPHGYWNEKIEEFFKNFQGDEISALDLLKSIDYPLEKTTGAMYNKIRRIGEKYGFSAIKKGKGRGGQLYLSKKLEGTFERVIKKVKEKPIVISEQDLIKWYEKEWWVVTCPYCQKKLYIRKQ